MNKTIKRIVAVALAIALSIPGTSVYAKSTDRLSKTKITMTDTSKTYTLKLISKAKKSKIKWESNVKADNAEAAGQNISLKVSTDKKKVSITPLKSGKGQIVCTVGKKKLICSYTVNLPEKVDSHFSDVVDYLQINSVNAVGTDNLNFGEIQLSNAYTNVYGYYEGESRMRFDVGGGYTGTSDYFTATFYVDNSGKVTDVVIRERAGSTYIYKATRASAKAASIKKGCKSITFSTIPEPGVTQTSDTCNTLAQRVFDVALQSVNQALVNKLGYGISSIGFTNYK